MCVGPDLEITTGDDGTVDIIFFQDQEMKLFFESYPELMLLDATYKLTNVRMTLYVMLCVGPNGESEIVAVFFTPFEDCRTLSAALELFKARNPNWCKVRTVMTDKDMAERDALRSKLPQASLLLCLFHVLRAIGREVTTSKMSITEPVRTSALHLFQAIAYATTEQQYTDLHDKLHATMPPSVVRYYETNWHPCRFEWVLCWQRQNVTFGERTNNRLESVNRRLKAVIKPGSSLPVFFTDLIATIKCMHHERDQCFVKTLEKVSIDPFPLGSVEGKYASSVTSFALQFIVKQLKLSDSTDVTVEDDHAAATVLIDGVSTEVTPDECPCPFWKSMGLPCQHVFAIRHHLQLQIFSLSGIWPRWLKNSVADKHRLFHKPEDNAEPVVNVSHHVSKPLTQSQKFHHCKRVV